MTKTPCPVCDDGKIPVEFDFFPYSDALDCPYCGGDRFLDPEDPHAAGLLMELASVDVTSPEFQERATQKAIQRFEHRVREPQPCE